MNKSILILVFLLITNAALSQKKPYVIYNDQGKKVSYEKMLKSLGKSDIILFGEFHDNPIAHWLQYEVTSDLNAHKSLILGAEMLEADGQESVNDYLNDRISSKGLDSLVKLWPNYKTDYAPLVNFAKDKQLPFIATNIPRPYANLVYKKGFDALDSLSNAQKEWIAPLPIEFDSELSTYKDFLNTMGDHGSPELVMAQAMKDATMAHFILKNYRDGHLFIHYNGAHHSDYYEGILWYLKKERDDLKYTTISTVSQEDVNTLDKENLKKADFIICVDSHMTSTIYIVGMDQK